MQPNGEILINPCENGTLLMQKNGSVYSEAREDKAQTFFVNRKRVPVCSVHIDSIDTTIRRTIHCLHYKYTKTTEKRTHL